MRLYLIRSLLLFEIVFELSACRTNVFQPVSEVSSHESDEKVVSKFILEGKLKDAVARLRKMLDDKLDKEKREKYERLLAMTIISQLGINMENIVDIDKGTKKEKLNKSIKIAPEPTLDNLNKFDEAIALLKKNPNPNRTDFEYLQAARAAKSSSLLKKSRKQDGSFDKKSANEQMTDEDVNEILKLMKESESDYEERGDEKKGETIHRQLNDIDKQSGSSTKEKLINFLEEIDHSD